MRNIFWVITNSVYAFKGGNVCSGRRPEIVSLTIGDVFESHTVRYKMNQPQREFGKGGLSPHTDWAIKAARPDFHRNFSIIFFKCKNEKQTQTCEQASDNAHNTYYVCTSVMDVIYALLIFMHELRHNFNPKRGYGRSQCKWWRTCAYSLIVGKNYDAMHEY